MVQLQSRIISDNLTDADLDGLKNAAADAAIRKTKFEGWRTADEAKITVLTTTYALGASVKQQITDTSRATRNVYLNGATLDGGVRILKISELLPPWSNNPSGNIMLAFSNSTKTTKQADYENLQKVVKSVNDLSHDIGLMTTFINSYNSYKNRFCTTNDVTNNPTFLGTVRMYIAGTQIIDVCEGSSVKQVACVRNKVTLGTNNVPVATASTCPDGCREGVCLGGSLGALSTVKSDGSAFTDIKTAHPFYVKAASVSISTGQNLSADIVLPAGCTSTGESTFAVPSATTPIQFGPITCTTAGVKAVRVNLKSGTSILSNQNLNITITQNVADRFEITIPTTLVAGSPFSATVTIYGGNNTVYTTYDKKLYISLIGNGDVTFPEAEIAFTNGVATVPGLIFSTATTGTEKYTIKATSADRLIEKEIEVSVAAAQ